MKKSLVALAVLTVTGVASAQSSVTLFGVMDAGVSQYTVKSAFYSNTLFAAPPLVAPAGVERRQTALSNSGYTSSRLGFRGTEDLGGGLAASFWLEAGVANDTGLGNAVGNVFAFNRRSTVSLSGGFGEIRLGRDFTPTFMSNALFDPFNTNGVGANLIHSVETALHTARGPGSAGSASDNYVRASNSIGYFLPPTLGGFYGQAMYALHENTKVSDLAGSPSKRGRYVGGRFGYANGPLDVAVSYGESTAADATAVTPAGVATGARTQNTIKTTNLGASYDFGAVKLFGEIWRAVDDLRTTAVVPVFGPFQTVDKDKYAGALVGVHVPVGAGLIRASYSRVTYKNDLPSVVPTPFGTTNLDASVNKIAIGYVHNLSKRTALYATAARIRIKNGQNNPAIMGVTTGGSPTFLSTGAGTTGYAPRVATGYDFGIRHSF